MPADVPVLLLDGLRFPEGPAFAPDGSLWLVELHGGALMRYADGRGERVAVGGEPNGAIVDARGRVWFCDAGAGAIRRLDPATGRIGTLCAARDGRPLFRPNDCAFDAAGHLLFTCPGDSRREPTGHVCCLAPDGTLTVIAEGLYFPNGLALDGDDLIVAETYRQRLWRGRWDAATRHWSGRPWGEPLPGEPGPDGMALDAAGHLHVAVFGAGVIAVLDRTGTVTARLPMPGHRPTNAAFDPAGRLGLVVTEAGRGELLSLPGCGPGTPLHTGSAWP
jgi:gluconolactonase